MRRRLSSFGPDNYEVLDSSVDTDSTETNLAPSDRGTRSSASQLGADKQIQRVIIDTEKSDDCKSDDSEILTCPICFDRRWDTACVPCGHLLCSECADRI